MEVSLGLKNSVFNFKFLQSFGVKIEIEHLHLSLIHLGLSYKTKSVLRPALHQKIRISPDDLGCLYPVIYRVYTFLQVDAIGTQADNHHDWCDTVKRVF